MGIKRAIRRVAIVGAVVGFACLPRVGQAAPLFESIYTDCSVDRVTALPKAGPCPNYAYNLLGDATALGSFDGNTGGFAVQTHVAPHAPLPLVVGQRHATTIVMGTRTATSAAGGQIKVVFDDLSSATVGGGGIKLGQSSGTTGLGVSLSFHTPAGTDPQGTVCLLSFNGQPVPQQFVYPDDCSQPIDTLSAPPNSTFDITVMAVGFSDAVGFASGHASLSGRVAEVRVP